MWLAETAVNRSVLDLLATEGIQFTILAPTSAPASVPCNRNLNPPHRTTISLQLTTRTSN